MEEWLDSFINFAFGEKFLALDGPSGFGKTVFCESLAPGRLFHTSCENGPEPNPRRERPTRHNAGLLDEATPSLVIANKSLFQALATGVRLGTSSSKCNAYAAQVCKNLLKVTSSKWRALRAALGEEDHGRIEED